MNEVMKPQSGSCTVSKPDYPGIRIFQMLVELRPYSGKTAQIKGLKIMRLIPENPGTFGTWAITIGTQLSPNKGF